MIEFNDRTFPAIDLAVNLGAYWGSDECYQRDGYPRAPYSDDPSVAAEIAHLVAIADRLTCQGNPVFGPHDFTADDLAALTKALDELQGMPEFWPFDLTLDMVAEATQTVTSGCAEADR